MNPEPQYPIRDVHQILRACNAAEPLRPGDQRWYDLAPLRHARVLTRLEKVFRATPAESEFHHRLIYGHRGCGKSTDLLSFKQWADANGFCAQHTEVNVHFGQIRLEFSDLFLLAASVAESAVRELGQPLPAGAVRPIVEWFAEVTKEQREQRTSELSAEAGGQLGGSLPFGLGKLVAKFASATKAGSSHSEVVRQQMRNYPDQLIDRTNALLRQANDLCTQSGRTRGLIVLFDNLDRYNPEEISEVLLRGASLLQRLGCHAMYTIPIDLAYNPRVGPSRDAHGQPIMIPMISLRHRGSPWENTVVESPYDEGAVAQMEQALGKRIATEVLFENSADARRVVRFCGGCIRDLMHIITLTYEMSEGDRLTSAGVDKAIRALRADYVRELSEEDYQRLGQIAANHAVPRDERTLKLLFNRQALEYCDGDHVWMDVHPIVVEIDEFQTAYRKHRTILPG
jgi:hypothetical protein